MKIKTEIFNSAKVLLIFIVINALLYMSVVITNGRMSLYDALLITSTYSYMSFYLLIPLIFIAEIKEYSRDVVIIRYKSAWKIWMDMCKKGFIYSFKYDVLLLISVFADGLFFSYTVCDWENPESIFARHNFETVREVPQLSIIIVCIFLSFYINILMSEIIILFSFWIFNSYYYGYIIIVIMHLLPAIPFTNINLYQMNVLYSDFLGENGFAQRVVLLLCVELIITAVLLYAGLIRKKKDYI